MEINNSKKEDYEQYNELDYLEKRVNIASMLKNNLLDDNGASYFNNDWLSKHILGLTDDEIKENKDAIGL